MDPHLSAIEARLRRLEAIVAPPAPPERTVPGRLQLLVRCAAELSGQPERALMGRARTAPIARVRQALYWLLRHRAQRSLSEIGNFFDRDHTTVLHGLRAHEARVGVMPEAGAMTRAIEALWRERMAALGQGKSEPQEGYEP
jgi:hypothetical protein